MKPITQAANELRVALAERFKDSLLYIRPYNGKRKTCCLEIYGPDFPKHRKAVGDFLRGRGWWVTGLSSSIIQKVDSFQTEDGYTLYFTNQRWADSLESGKADLIFNPGSDGMPVDTQGQPVPGTFIAGIA